MPQDLCPYTLTFLKCRKKAKYDKNGSDGQTLDLSSTLELSQHFVNHKPVSDCQKSFNAKTLAFSMGTKFATIGK